MNFQPMPLTVGNAKLLQEWQDKLAAYIESTSKDRIMASISRLCAEDAEFAALVDKAITNGGTFTELDLAEWAKTNVVKAAALHKQMQELPHTLSALMLGIDCIKATFDRTKLADQDAKEFDSEGFWHHVTMADVQKYCTNLMDMR
jgi:hypothetical protein